MIDCGRPVGSRYSASEGWFGVPVRCWQLRIADHCFSVRRPSDRSGHIVEGLEFISVVTSILIYKYLNNLINRSVLRIDIILTSSDPFLNQEVGILKFTEYPFAKRSALSQIHSFILHFLLLPPPSLAKSPLSLSPYFK